VGGRSQRRQGGQGSHARERHNRVSCPSPDYLGGLGGRASVCHAVPVLREESLRRNGENGGCPVLWPLVNQHFHAIGLLPAEAGLRLWAGVADRQLPLYLANMKFSIGYFAKPRFPGIMPALLATYTGDFDTLDDARKAAIADADNPKIGAVDSITIEPIGEQWVEGESLVRTGSGWEPRREEPE
jgi:hypothetical protein